MTIEMPKDATYVGTPPHELATPLSGYNVAPLTDNPTRWATYRCFTSGHVELLTPLYDGKLRGEMKQVAVARLKRHLMAEVAGIGRRGAI